MAFTTELVARSGPLAQVVQGERTSGTSIWSDTLTLPPGTWMVVARCRGSLTASSDLTRNIEIDGTVVLRWKAGTDPDLRQVAAVAPSVTGGRTITISSDGTFSGNAGWDFYAVRTG